MWWKAAILKCKLAFHHITYVPDYKIYVEIFKLIASSLTKRILKFDIHYTIISVNIITQYTTTGNVRITWRWGGFKQSCSGKAISITISECVSVALVSRQENCILSASYYIVICGLPGCTVFSTFFFHKRRDVWGRKVFNIKCVLILCTNFVRITAHSKNNSARYYYTRMFHVKQVKYRHGQILRVPVA